VTNEATGTQAPIGAEFGAELVEASLVTGRGIHEVFAALAKSWVRFRDAQMKKKRSAGNQ
jgi:hypothetical protein